MKVFFSRLHDWITDTWEEWGEHRHRIVDQICMNYGIVALRLDVDYAIFDTHVELFAVPDVLKDETVFVHLAGPVPRKEDLMAFWLETLKNRFRLCANVHDVF
jgi:hypothetical protein